MLYDRQPGETTKAYEAFTVYRDLGMGRTLERVSATLQKSVTMLGRWSSQYRWIERAAAYDDYIEAQARKKNERDAIRRKADMLKRHALTGKVLQQKGVKYLDETPKPIDRAQDAIAAIRTGIEIERKAENLPDWIFEVVDAPDDDLLRQYNELLTQVGGAGSGDETAGHPDTGETPPATDEPA